ncbi:hypothetical protein CSC94_17920 [Zhengella mangrovi]|uniref:Chemotaxis protein MotC n=1 Tax=Zhengella mangrovi TaxID=1982044 RepID=A0A2G1QJN1_9HYPH|nr:hypothetical protein [Zhengella mangrovi]PHP65726.1 hypothetical protein CSC94_17920 [Zhengella mangrovi]
MSTGHRVALAVMLTLLAGAPALAADHGGSEHGGEAAAPGKVPEAPPLPAPRASALPGASAMLSGLYQVQDSIVKGDRDALKLQGDILKMMREQLRAMRGKPVLPDTDISPVIVFALAGGDPVAAVQVLAFVPDDHPEVDLAKAIVSYLRRDTKTAASRLKDIDVRDLPLPLGAYVAMAKANASIGSNKEVAAENFNLVRLLAPGTLLEEVALRRLVWLSATTGDAEGFYDRAASYAHRFGTSPYFSQFLKFFMQGVVKLPTAPGIDSVMDLLPAASRVPVKMRLSREALVAGRTELAEKLSRSLLADLSDRADKRVQRAHLYSALTQVAKGELVRAWSTLKHVRRDDLPDNDKGLLDAAVAAVNQATDGDPESAALVTSALGGEDAGAHDGADAPQDGTEGGQAAKTGDAEPGSDPKAAEAEALADLKPLMDQAGEQMNAVDDLLKSLPRRGAP